MPRSVLLVDDTAFLRSMLREILETGGDFQVVAEASDGIDALTLQPELQPDLVISDLIMPGLDGIEMTRALVGSDPAVRVVVSAAEDQEGALHRALAAGAREFLPKPFVPDRVLRLLQELSVPAEPEGQEWRDLRVHLDLERTTPLPSARARVLLLRCRPLGEVREVSPDETALARGGDLESLEFTLRTRRPSPQVQEWLRKLPSVAGASVAEPPPPPDVAAQEEPEPPGLAPGPGLPGMVRVRAARLDRLLERLEASLADRDQLARLLDRIGMEPEAAASLRTLGHHLAEMRTEILAARLVPFDRIARRLERRAGEAAASSSRLAALVLTGGDVRVDLAVLGEIAFLLEKMLPAFVDAGIQRRDLLRQLGKPEEGEIRLDVSRTGTALVLTVAPADAGGGPPDQLLDDESLDRIRHLGGRAGIFSDGDRWRLELTVPAGVSVVRSYLGQAGRRLFAVPVGIVEEAIELDAGEIRVREGRSVWEKEPGRSIPVVRFDRVPWVTAEGSSRRGYPALLYRVGPQRYALALDALFGEADVVVRPARAGGGSRAVAGTALLPDGDIAVVPDLPHLARVR